MVRFSADGYATAEHAMIECAGGNFPAGAIPMQRRTFLGVTAGARAALASKPLALAEEQERKNPVPYPDPAVEVIDPRFAKFKVINGAVELTRRHTVGGRSRLVYGWEVSALQRHS